MNTLFVLTGPTGVGKTDLSLAIAQRLNSPIINADSRQIYRQLPIGTAAPTPQQQALVKHYFVGTLDLDQYYSAAEYEQDVISLLPGLFAQTPNLLLTGGSMMYIDAVCNGIDDIPTVDAETRRVLKQRYESEGLEPLRNELKALDPEHYERVDLNNPRRVIHALEICRMTGLSYSSFLTRQTKQRPFRIVKIGLNRPREELFARINQRVLDMIDMGLQEEARTVYPLRHLNSLNTVGYKEMFKFFDGYWDLDTAAQKMQRNTRVYAKKQLTWFKKDPAVTWFNPSDEPAVLDFVASHMG
jgi:tRNA dimethylallyltransferase